MSEFIYQTKLNFTRIVLRNLNFFFFDLMLPVVFYLLYTKVLSSGVPNDTLKQWNVAYLVSMMVFSSLLGSVITVANTLLEEHTSHFDLFVDITPESKVKYYGSLIVVFLTLNLISLLSIGAIGVFVNHISLALPKMILVILTCLAGSFVLIFIGIAISLFKNPSSVNLVTSLTVFPMAMLSGLWWPLQTLPNWLQTIGKMMPTYSISAISNDIISGNNFQFSNLFNFVIWLVILILVIVVGSRLTATKELETE